MTPAERELVRAMTWVDGRPPTKTPAQVTRALEVADGPGWVAEQLTRLEDERDVTDLDLALVAATRFGPVVAQVPPLLELLTSGWHGEHPRIVELLGRIGHPSVVPALTEVAEHPAPNLSPVEAETVGLGAVRALAQMSDPTARAALTRLAASASGHVADEAARLLSGPAATASAHGLPTIRVRRLPNDGLLGRRARYEVELTPLGRSTPEWTQITHHPRSLIAPHLGQAEASTPVRAADRDWHGGVGPWRSLFTADD